MLLSNGRALPPVLDDVAAGPGGGASVCPGQAVMPVLESARMVSPALPPGAGSAGGSDATAHDWSF
jgi:hypothetical protein